LGCALSRAAGERDVLGKWIDTIAIYAATLYPLIYGTTHLPRRFWVFLTNDFASMSLIIERVAAPNLLVRAGGLRFQSRISVVCAQGRESGQGYSSLLTTALCWYIGIVAYNSDYAFTVTNVGHPRSAVFCVDLLV
jgi:hypothetical protein